MRRHHQLFAFILALAASPTMLWANTEPTVEIKSAAMRPGTTLMDIVFRVNDPDDNTVKTRALAFKDGARSFSHVIKPTTFVEGTGSKFGDAIAANTDHTVTWDVAADWNIDLGQVKFEVLAMDNRGLLPFDWIGIPATSQNAAVTISKNSPSSDDVLDAFFWLYAGDDPDLVLQGSALRGASSAGVFSGLTLVDGSGLGNYAIPFIFKEMNLGVATPLETLTASRARAGQSSPWLASKTNWTGLDPIVAWGGYQWDGAEPYIPPGLANISKISSRVGQTVVISDGVLISWGYSGAPSLSGVIDAAAGANHGLAVTSDRRVVGWGDDWGGQISIPQDLRNVVAVAAGSHHSVALKSDGTVASWGYVDTNVPAGLDNVVKIACGNNSSFAIKGDGSVVGWGRGGGGVPQDLSGVIDVAAGGDHALALKNDGTIVVWKSGGGQPATVPTAAINVVAIAAGNNHSLALKADGTVVAWLSGGWGGGDEARRATNVPAGLSGVGLISAGGDRSLAVKAKAQ